MDNPIRHPADSYIGLRWQPQGDSREGVSCWGLVVLAYREQRGIALPVYAHAPDDLVAIAREIQAAIRRGEWQPVPPGQPQDWDVVTMARRDSPYHLGLWAAGHVLHVTEQVGAVVAETPVQLARRGYGRVLFWRRGA